MHVKFIRTDKTIATIGAANCIFLHSFAPLSKPELISTTVWSILEKGKSLYERQRNHWLGVYAYCLLIYFVPFCDCTRSMIFVRRITSYREKCK